MANAIVTVENLGVPIWERRCKNGEIVTIPDNTCRDISEEVYRELKLEYNLRVVGTIGGELSPDVPKPTPEPVVGPGVKQLMDGTNPEGKKTTDFLDGLKEASVFICSVCDRKFDTNQGMRLHMHKAHENR